MLKTRPILLFLTAIILIFSLNFDIGYSQEERVTVPTAEDQEFLSKILKAINFKDEIVISVGPYYGLDKINLGGMAISIGPDYSKAPSLLFYDDQSDVYYILIDYVFYKNLSTEERHFVIAHEVGHAQNPNLRKSILAEQAADEFALKYVKPGVIIDFLRKHSFESANEADLQRIENLMSKEK